MRFLYAFALLFLLTQAGSKKKSKGPASCADWIGTCDSATSDKSKDATKACTDDATCKTVCCEEWDDCGDWKEKGGTCSDTKKMYDPNKDLEKYALASRPQSCCIQRTCLLTMKDNQACTTANHVFNPKNFNNKCNSQADCTGNTCCMADTCGSTRNNGGIYTCGNAAMDLRYKQGGNYVNPIDIPCPAGGCDDATCCWTPACCTGSTVTCTSTTTTQTVAAVKGKIKTKNRMVVMACSHTGGHPNSAFTDDRDHMTAKLINNVKTDPALGTFVASGGHYASADGSVLPPKKKAAHTQEVSETEAKTPDQQVKHAIIGFALCLMITSILYRYTCSKARNDESYLKLADEIAEI